MWLTVDEVCAELGISRNTWDKWRQQERGPQAKRLPNRQLRIHRDWLNAWLADLPEY